MKNQMLKSNCLNIIGNFLLLMFVFAQSLDAQDDIISFNIGSLSVTLLSEGQRESGTNILIGATDEMQKKVIPTGTYPSATNVFLVEAGDKVLLFDAGLGQKTINNLALYGRKGSDVDAVFLTHLHGDHIGSLLLNGVKSYPNATLYISKPEHDYYMNDEAMMSLPENRRGSFTSVRNIINAYKDKLHVFTPSEIGNATGLFSGVSSVAAYGHTPGHVVYMMESEGEKLMLWGDLAHAMAIQMPFPEVAVTYDSEPAKAIESRQKLLKFIADNNMVVAGAHIQFPGVGRLTKSAPTGYVFSLLCACEGIAP
jgi:glyoxylase-like metal-dependent hydrolase (beta-lactamase superfamily II)